MTPTAAEEFESVSKKSKQTKNKQKTLKTQKLVTRNGRFRNLLTGLAGKSFKGFF